jgi:contact-dependent growth inhibition (CDI) system CdiI-like immunity protein
VKRQAKRKPEPEKKKKEEKWPLEIWYDEVCNTPVPSLSDRDLARAIRQQLWLDEAVPEGLRRCEANPECGELYDGEMLKALLMLGEKFWPAHAGMHAQLERCAAARIQAIEPEMGSLGENERTEIEAFLSALRGDPRGRWIDR